MLNDCRIERQELLDLKYNLFNQAFSFLPSNIPSNVICIYWNNGERIRKSGVLKNVVPYEYITIDDQDITFAGLGIAIEEIYSKDKRYCIYSNRDALANHRAANSRELIIAQNKMFGFSPEKERQDAIYSKTRRP